MNSLLNKPLFWFAFAATIIASLFLYGLRLVKEQGLLAQDKRTINSQDLEIARLKLSNTLLQRDKQTCRAELTKGLTEIQVQKRQVAAQMEKLRELQDLVQSKQVSIDDLAAKLETAQLRQSELLNTLEIARESLDRKEAELANATRLLKQEPLHPYGKGHAMLTLLKRCSCPNLTVYVDGELVGTLDAPSASEDIVCGARGSLTVVVLSGKHHVQAWDSRRHYWNLYTAIQEDGCEVRSFR